MKIHFKNRVFFLILFTFLIAFCYEIKAYSNNTNYIKNNVDINRDLYIDIKDIASLSLRYNETKSSPNWNNTYDINNDGVVDVYDLVLISKFMGDKVLIENVIDYIDQGQVFIAPSNISLRLSSGSTVGVPVSWSINKIDTNKAGIYDLSGYLEDYKTSIKLTLNILSSNKNSNILNLGYTAYKGEWVYYSNPVNGGKLSKAKLDGSSVTKINDDDTAFINLVGEDIYYCNFSEGGAIYKTSADGTNRTKIVSDSAIFMQVVDGWIYYQNVFDDYKLYRIDINGKNKVRLSDDIPLYVNIYGEYIYYSNLSNYGEIICISLDGSNRKTINEDYSSDIAISNDWIYYQNVDDYNALYKIKINGTNRTRIKGETGVDLNVVDTWIYYANINDNYKLYRLSSNGTINEQLTNFPVSKINVSGDRLFFLDKEYGIYLYSLKLDKTGLIWFGIDTKIAVVESLNETIGQGDSYSFPEVIPATMSDGSKLLYNVQWETNFIDTSKLGTYSCKGHIEGYNSDINLIVTVVERGNSNGNLAYGGLFAEKNGFIYFKNKEDNKLYKIKTDGTLRNMLSNDEPKYIHVIGDWVYYLNQSDGDKLYKIKTDGTGHAAVSSDSIHSLNVVGDWVYYSNSSDNYYLYKMKTDGSNKTLLSDEHVYYLNTMGDWIYYISALDNNRLCKIKKDGTQKDRLYEHSISSLIVSEGSIYFKNSTWYKMNLNCSNITGIDLGMGLTTDFIVYGDKIYYSNQNDNNNLYVKDINSTVSKKLSGNTAGMLHVVGDYIYYKNYSDGEKTYRVKNDGTEDQPFGVDTSINCIEDISINLKLNEKYILPQKILAVNKEGENILVPVLWNSNNVDTSKLGITFYEGTVNGYSNKVKLSLNVVDKDLIGNTTGNIFNNAFVAQNSNWVFVNNYKMKMDGSQKSKFTEDYVSSINVIGDLVFYTNGKQIKKINQDGSKAAIVCNDLTWKISLVGDWIYYINKSDGERLYKIRTSGLDKTKISDEEVLSFTVSDGWIYYSNHNTQYGTSDFYKVKTDGSGRIKISEGQPRGVNVVGDLIYYQSDISIISKMKTDGLNKTFITDVTQWCNLNYSGDWLYFEKDYKLAKAKIDGSSFTYLTNEQPVSINVLGDWIYYYADGGYYRIKSDGSQKQLINSIF